MGGFLALGGVGINDPLPNPIEKINISEYYEAATDTLSVYLIVGFPDADLIHCAGFLFCRKKAEVGDPIPKRFQEFEIIADIPRDALFNGTDDFTISSRITIGGWYKYFDTTVEENISYYYAVFPYNERRQIQTLLKIIPECKPVKY